ncbi:MAG: hypothetical protein ABIO39_05795 [Caulobacteraceae bacterium]
MTGRQAEGALKGRAGWLCIAAGLALAGCASTGAEGPAPASAPVAAVSDPSASASPRFSSYIDDLPIMPGLSETDQGYTFDLFQGGRMAEVRLTGASDAQAVRSFYAAILPRLGWTPTGPEVYIYRRGRERMIFRVEPAKGAPGLNAIFVVTPETPTAPQDRRRRP